MRVSLFGVDHTWMLSRGWKRREVAGAREKEGDERGRVFRRVEGLEGEGDGKTGSVVFKAWLRGPL